MFITTHAAIGALIGENLPGSPWLAFFLALLSHFVADIIPHGDSDLYKGFVSGSKVKKAIAYVTIDAIVALILIIWLFNQEVFVDKKAVSYGIVAGVLPDLLVAGYELFKLRALRAFTKFHFFFHNMISSRKGDLPFAWGMAMQIVVLLVIVSRLG
jgi:hypothetical protein